MQVPEQVVVERGAHPNEPFAVVDQQPDVELDAGQLGDRQPVDALPERGAGDGERVDAVGLAALAAAAALAGHQPGRDPNDTLAVDQQEPLEGCPRHAGSPPAPTPARRPGRAPNPAPRRTRARRPAIVLSPSSSPVLAPTAAIVCELLCMSAPSTIIGLRPFHLD